MRISQMKEREEFDRILVDTLARGWSRQYGRAIEVRLGREQAGQHFALQPILSAYCSPSADSSVRRFLRDSFRFTPFVRRAVPQWILGTAATTSLGLWLTGRAGFSVTPAIENADSIVVLPGNQRIRVFDFSHQRVRTFLKTGFANDSMRTEVEVRSAGEGPYTPIVDSGEDFEWFEEPILDGYDLTRCPPWLPKGKLLRRAFEVLDAWSLPHAHRVDAAGYVADLLQRAERAIDDVRIRFDFERCADLTRAVKVLAELAGAADQVELSRSHGDLQPGNIRTDRRGKRVWVLDWEHSAQRSRHYDRFVFGLRSRSAHGLAERLTAFVAGRDTGHDWVFESLPQNASWKRRQLALFLLEDLIWFLSESLAGPTLQVSQGLTLYVDELEGLGPDLAQIRG